MIVYAVGCKLIVLLFKIITLIYLFQILDAFSFKLSIPESTVLTFEVKPI